jgi:predicted SprT family Zn-dependent metalloprotease
MISIVLDSRQTPQYVIDHVMHHELLHKALGVWVVNGRRMAHTAEFKALEREFEGFQRAQEHLKVLSTELRFS